MTPTYRLITRWTTRSRNATDYFQTFISSQQNIGGTNYNVLYGGIQWGFSFHTMDIVPEPGSLALVTVFVGTAVLWRRLRLTV